MARSESATAGDFELLKKDTVTITAPPSPGRPDHDDEPIAVLTGEGDDLFVGCERSSRADQGGRDGVLLPTRMNGISIGLCPRVCVLAVGRPMGTRISVEKPVQRMKTKAL